MKSVRVYIADLVSPCGVYASSCSVGTGVSHLSVWLQAPVHSLGAMSECLYESHIHTPPKISLLPS